VFNSGNPLDGALVLAILLPTASFLLARSSIGFLRWRLQRELWRRDVEHLRELDQRRNGAGRRSALERSTVRAHS
jgi:hypothetical protein